jgi:hypothetical protein
LDLGTLVFFLFLKIQCFLGIFLAFVASLVAQKHKLISEIVSHTPPLLNSLNITVFTFNFFLTVISQFENFFNWKAGSSGSQNKIQSSHYLQKVTKYY